MVNANIISTKWTVEIKLLVHITFDYKFAILLENILTLIYLHIHNYYHYLFKFITTRGGYARTYLSELGAFFFLKFLFHIFFFFF